MSGSVRRSPGVSLIYLLELALSSFSRAFLAFPQFIRAPGFEVLIKGGVVSLGADWTCVEVPCLDALRLNWALYIPLRTFAYSS